MKDNMALWLTDIHRVSEKGALLFLLELSKISTNCFYKSWYENGKMTEIVCYIVHIHFAPHLTYATVLPC